jgi:hypothetical protein
MQKRALELAARKDIDLAGLGQLLPEEVPRAILVGRRTDESVRPDRPGPGRGCRGRLRAAAATTPPVVGLTDARRVEWRIASLHGRPAANPPRQDSAPGVRPGRQRVNISFERYLFAICRRHEIRSQCGVVGPFPRRNGILATFPFGIDVRHDDRAMEGFPVFP